MMKASQVGREMMHAKTRPLTQDEMRMLALVFKWRTEGTPPEAAGALPTHHVLVERLGQAGVRVEPSLAALVAFMADRPATAVLFAAALHSYNEELKKKGKVDAVINAYTFGDFIFPNGIPTDEEMQRIWHMQKDPKAPQGNSLDVLAAWVE